jgi:hypothetical protein
VSHSDLANAVLTTAVEACGWRWTEGTAEASSILVNRPVVDLPGLAKPPEKRKVGGSTPPLTTTIARLSNLLTCGNATLEITAPIALPARSGPFTTAVFRPLLHVDCTRCP